MFQNKRNDDKQMKKKLPFIPDTMLADIIHADYQLIPVIGRFGIEFGFGNKTVKEVCHEKGINVLFVLDIINSYHDDDYFPKERLQQYPASLIIDYLSRTHNYYLSDKVPEIQDYIAEMELNVSLNNLKNIKLLDKFFADYIKELSRHLNYEDDVIFPYIKDLESSLNMKFVSNALIKKIKKEPIDQFEKNHDNIEVKLSDLKNLIIKFLPPVLCASTCQKLLIELFRLESDINNHSRIEEKVLIQKVKQLEKEILKQGETTT